MPYTELIFNHTFTAFLIVACGVALLSFEFVPRITSLLSVCFLFTIIAVFMFYTAKIFNVVLQKKGDY